MNVLEEKAVKKQNEMSRRGINLYYFFFLDILLSAGLYWIDVLGGYHPMVWQCLFNSRLWSKVCVPGLP